jgi:hypothetical protein
MKHNEIIQPTVTAFLFGRFVGYSKSSTASVSSDAVAAADHLVTNLSCSMMIILALIIPDAQIIKDTATILK